MQLSYQGAEQQKNWPAKNYDYAAAGTYGHYRWQGAGLSAGFLTDVEVKVSTPYGVAGSADGILSDGSVFELKTTGNWKG